jgi:hypothetical protein
MRWCVPIAAVLVTASIVRADPAGMAASAAKPQLAQGNDNVASVDVELVIAVDVSYSMDLDELAIQREGYAQAVESKEFLQALNTGPNRRVAVTYSSGRHQAIKRSSFHGA